MEQYNIGRTLSRTFNLVIKTITSVGLFILILQLVSMGFQFLVQNQLMGSVMSAQQAGDPDAALALFGSGWYWGSLILSVVLGTLTFSGSIWGYLKAANEEPVSLGDCFSAGFAKLLPVLALSFLWFLGVGIGWILLIVPGVILITMWSVSVPALVAENTGVIGAFGRSRELTRGSRMMIFLTLLIFLVLIYVVMFVLLGAVMGAAFGGGMMAGGPEAAMGMSMGVVAAMLPVQWLLASVLTALLASMYIETVTIKDGAAPGQLTGVFE